MLVTLPWYTSAVEYERFRAAADDRSDFFDSYEDWRQAALRHEQRAESRGVPLVRIRLRWDEFVAWQAISNARNNAEGRSEFADWRASQVVG
ncbi:MAG: hypothetical protein RLY70_3217 [Planctomycetota bacterium]|jgi:hypothetical protein